MQAFLAYVRQIAPNCMIVGFGHWPANTNNANGTVSAANLVLEQNMQQAFTNFVSAGDTNSFFIPLNQSQSGLPWVYGTGLVSAQTGVGNSDSWSWDGNHPTALAHKEYMPRQYVENFKVLLNSLII
jgi:hypothetical protein